MSDVGKRLIEAAQEAAGVARDWEYESLPDDTLVSVTKGQLVAKDAEIERLTKGNEAMKRILASIMPEQIPGPFICGAVGQPGNDGLHDGYMICPTYGADHRTTTLYRRQKK